MDIQNKRVLTLEEGSAFLGYKKNYVKKLVQKGILPTSKPLGKIFFDRKKLENWALSASTDNKVNRKVNG